MVLNTNIFKTLRTVNFRLYFSILALMLFPTAYQTVRIHFLGDLPQAAGLNIAGQMQWVGLIYEVIQEALILPLFYALGQFVNDKGEFQNRIKTGLLATVSIYGGLSIFIYIFARPLLLLMGQDPGLLEASLAYIRLETLAMVMVTAFKFIYVVLVILKKERHLYITLTVQMVLSVILDTFLVSNLDLSLKMGVNGIPITNLTVNGVVIAVGLVLLKKEGLNIFGRGQLDFKWFREWWAVGRYSGLESLVRNLGFAVMIVRMMNLIQEQGNFWLANHFIWQWLLLPALALGDLVKQEVAQGGRWAENVKAGFPAYMLLCVIFSLFWLGSIPFWPFFLARIMNVQALSTVYFLVIAQTPVYLTFIFNNTLDSIFYGSGRTDYMLYQSLLVNIAVNGLAFLLYLNGLFTPTLISLTILFSCGMLADFIITLFMFCRFIRLNGLKL